MGPHSPCLPHRSPAPRSSPRSSCASNPHDPHAERPDRVLVHRARVRDRRHVRSRGRDVGCDEHRRDGSRNCKAHLDDRSSRRLALDVTAVSPAAPSTKSHAGSMGTPPIEGKGNVENGVARTVCPRQRNENASLTVRSSLRAGNSEPMTDEPQDRDEDQGEHEHPARVARDVASAARRRRSGAGSDSAVGRNTRPRPPLGAHVRRRLALRAPPGRKHSPKLCPTCP